MGGEGKRRGGGGGGGHRVEVINGKRQLIGIWLNNKGIISAIYSYWNLIQRILEWIDKQANREVKKRNSRNRKQGRAEQGRKQTANTCCSLLHKQNKQTERQLSTILTT